MKVKHFLGNYNELAMGVVKACKYPLSYLAQDWPELASWQSMARGRILELLAYWPKSCPLNVRVERAYEYDGLMVEHISYEQPYGARTEGIFLKPAGVQGKLPGVVALHDHGGFKYFGKEKITGLPGEPEILKEFKEECYGGVSWANELAKRGFAVFVPDVFLWGSRKMTAEDVPEEFVENLKKQEPGTRAYIEAYNDFAGGYETVIAKSLFLAGTTWPGIMAYEDRRAVDYLVSRADVDDSRIGCGGLSGGGQRTIFLAGLDARIKCAVCVGFMSTFAETVEKNITWHTWMLHLPHMANLMDLPDLISLHAGPLMVQYDTEDPLWSLQGERDSNEKLEKIYAKMNIPEKYSGKFYPGPHKFDREMQNDAFDWMERWLKES